MADQPQRCSTTLAVLAGGRGSRMGGPKDRLILEGKPVLAFLLDRFDWPGPTMLVTAPHAQAAAGAERFSVVVADPVEGEGPLRGVITALNACTTDLLLVTTVDMPGWTADTLGGLLAALLGTPKSLGVMYRRCDRVEPFPLAVRTTATSLITERFAAGKTSPQSLSNEPGFSVVDTPAHWPATTWANLNRPADVRAFSRARFVRP